VCYAPPQTGVQGKVTSGGAPVQGAGVSLSPGGARAVTDAEGHYLISIAFTTATATVAGVAEIADLKSLSVNGESVATSAGRFSVDVTPQPGANQIDVVAVRVHGQTVEAHVGVSYKAAPAAASTGCASAGLAELLALLPLAAFLRRRT
jgi:hypothetical protein